MANKTPWLDKKGKQLNDTELREICKDWKPSQWEEYLQSIESGQTELLLSNPIEQYLSGTVVSEVEVTEEENEENNNHSRLFDLLNQSLEQLTTNQKNIIEAIYWNDHTLQEIADELDISKVAVSLTRDRAFKQIAKFMLSHIFEQHMEAKYQHLRKPKVNGVNKGGCHIHIGKKTKITKENNWQQKQSA